MTRINKAVYALCALLTVWVMTACNNYETYGDKKNKERDAIAQFIKDRNINVIDESQFEAQGCTTDTAKNEYVYLAKSAIYMQIIRKGSGTPLEENKQVNVLVRFLEYNIQDLTYISNYTMQTYDKMTVKRTGTSYSASFVFGQLYSVYGSASVPAGWLVPLMYINLGRPSEEGLAKVRLIVPHSQGTANASGNVYACYYELMYEREK